MEKKNLENKIIHKYFSNDHINRWHFNNFLTNWEHEYFWVNVMHEWKKIFIIRSTSIRNGISDGNRFNILTYTNWHEFRLKISRCRWIWDIKPFKILESKKKLSLRFLTCTTIIVNIVKREITLRMTLLIFFARDMRRILW